MDIVDKGFTVSPEVREKIAKEYQEFQEYKKKKQMKHDERSIERDCIAYARRRGWDCWKNENNGNKGIPDYSLLSPDGRFVMVEFKRSATAHVRPEQKTWAARHPGVVFFCHDLEDFKKILEPRRIVCGDCIRILDECDGFKEATHKPCLRFKLNIER